MSQVLTYIYIYKVKHKDLSEPQRATAPWEYRHFHFSPALTTLWSRVAICWSLVEKTDRMVIMTFLNACAVFSKRATFTLVSFSGSLLGSNCWLCDWPHPYDRGVCLWNGELFGRQQLPPSHLWSTLSVLCPHSLFCFHTDHPGNFPVNKTHS